MFQFFISYYVKYTNMSKESVDDFEVSFLKDLFKLLLVIGARKT